MLVRWSGWCACWLTMSIDIKSCRGFGHPALRQLSHIVWCWHAVLQLMWIALLYIHGMPAVEGVTQQLPPTSTGGAGTSQSALRKMCHHGFLSLHTVLWTFLRGDFLQSAADATYRAILLPWRVHRVIMNPNNVPAAQVAQVVAKHMALEGGSILIRYVVTSAGVPHPHLRAWPVCAITHE